VRERALTMSSAVHELIHWSSTSEQCDVQKFVEKYSQLLPLLVRIAEGYAGRDETMHLVAQNEVSQSLGPPHLSCILAACLKYGVARKQVWLRPKSKTKV